jgi:hypothetical protein
MTARCPDPAKDLVGPDARVRLVPDGDADLDVLAEDLALGAVEGEAVQRRQRIGRDRRADPLDDVTVVIVVRGLDQEELEDSAGGRCGLNGELLAPLRFGRRDRPAARQCTRIRDPPPSAASRCAD